MVVPPAVEVIEATLAPAFLISGTSVFLNFAQNRLFRAMDRVRAATDPAHADHAGRPRLLKRARLLRNAIALGVLTCGLTVTAAILVMGGELFARESLIGAAPYSFALALLTFFAAMLCVFADTVISVASVEAQGKTR
ncbi:MAG: DUF2721 domain-containing protein [Candidatus Thermoplasmatota archaeon]